MLGSDYATAINEMTKPSDVSSAIAEVETAIGLVVVASNIADVNWNSALTDVSLNIGETKTLMGNITGAVDGANAKVDITKMPINYSVSPATQNGTTIEIDKNGNITIKGGGENADINMEVTAEILGVRYSKTVNVKVKEVTITDSDVLNNASGVTMGDYYKKDFEQTKNSAIRNVNEYISTLTEELKASGYNETIIAKIDKAAELTKKYYEALISAMADNSGTETTNGNYQVEFTYTNENGTPVTEKVWYEHYYKHEEYGVPYGDGRWKEYGVNTDRYTKDLIKDYVEKSTIESGIILIEYAPTSVIGDLAANYYSISVNNAQIANKLMEFFNKIK